MSSNSTAAVHIDSYYAYRPSHVLPAVFAAIIGLSLILHIYQNFRYRFWRVTFFMCWGGSVYVTGWIVRCISSFHVADKNLYIVQYVFIYAGPPIFSAAEYNLLGRLMHYLPMHASLNPGRVTIFFVYLGAAVEAVTAAGAAKMATAGQDMSVYKSGGTLISIGVVLQAVIEFLLICMVGMLHYRCARANMLPSNVRHLFIMIYGTSTLVMMRCIFRAVESFKEYSADSCTGDCLAILTHEWYLYAFDAAPMVLYTCWLNIIHPGRFLPRNKNQYLDLDGKTERLGPGWNENRSSWKTFLDPFDLAGLAQGTPHYDQFWLRSENWPICREAHVGNRRAYNAVREVEQDVRMKTPV